MTRTTTSKHLSPVYQGRDKYADTRHATTTAAISQQTGRQKPRISKKLTPYEPEWLWDYDYFIFAR